MQYVYTDYTLHGKNIVHLTQGSNTLHFWYDASGHPALVAFNGMKYAYIHNLQGDIVGIVDSNGTEVIKYIYDSWGKLLSTTGSLASTLGKLNPFRYRGYVYDEETGLYYLRSRYYNPEWGRFINCDAILGENYKISSFNLYVYCKNAPTLYNDSDGYMEVITGGYLIYEFFQLVIEVGIVLLGGTLAYELGTEAAESIDYSYVTTIGADMYIPGPIPTPAPDSAPIIIETTIVMPLPGPRPTLSETPAPTTVMETEHHKKGTTNKANKQKHEEGQSRKKRDKNGGEKGDKRRPDKRSNKRRGIIFFLDDDDATPEYLHE